MARSTIFTLSFLTFLPLFAGCGGESGSGTGDVQVFVEPEESIRGGLQPGQGEENIKDGWTVNYDKFLITIGNLRAGRSDSDERLSDPTVWVLDLKNAPAGGYVIHTFEDASAARWDRFGFDLPNAKAGVKTMAPTKQADADMMVQNGYSVYFEGSMEKEGKTVAFRWGLPAGTSFDDCATEDGLLGFAVPQGGAVQVKPTIHGDHWFFSNPTSGAEITERYAQYIADSDADMNGETTLDELKQMLAADAFPSPPYSLAGGGLDGPIENAYDYVLSQARTLGDFQGDGECPTRKVLP